MSDEKNVYALRDTDTRNGNIIGIIRTTRSNDEIQEIIDDIRETREDYDLDMVIDALPEDCEWESFPETDIDDVWF